MTPRDGQLRWVLLVVLGLDLVVAAALGAERLAALGEGPGPSESLAVAGLVLLPVGLAVVGLTAHRLAVLSHDAASRGSAARASATTRAEVGPPVAGTEHRVREVLRAGSLRMALQPIIDVATGRWIGVEALARFPDNGRPDRWFAEAQDAGLGIELEATAFEAALRTLRELPDDVYLSVNASPALLLDARLDALLRAPGLPIERIVLEITEHSAVTRYDDIRRALRPHRSRGLRLAVDDAGAGYASFNHVLTLRPDTIKLDRSLVTDVETDGARRALVAAIVLLALEMNAAVTAEGVETAAELDLLSLLGVDAVQGHLFAPPELDRGRLAGWARRDWLSGAGGRVTPARAPH